MPRLRSLARPFLAALVAAVGASCSDPGEDSLAGACRLIVDRCGVGETVGACLDLLGDEPPDCVDCVAESECDYAACQTLPGCRIPLELLPP